MNESIAIAAAPCRSQWRTFIQSDTDAPELAKYKHYVEQLAQATRWPIEQVKALYGDILAG